MFIAKFIFDMTTTSWVFCILAIIITCVSIFLFALRWLGTSPGEQHGKMETEPIEPTDEEEGEGEGE